MPIYEYGCPRCGTFEVNQRITEAPLRRCPTCRGRVSRLISNTSFQLRGSGWYATDYASKGKNGKGESSSEASKSEAPAKDASPSKESSSKEASKESSASKSEAAASGA